jgi:hypothetical protein
LRLIRDGVCLAIEGLADIQNVPAAIGEMCCIEINDRLPDFESIGKDPS